MKQLKLLALMMLAALLPQALNAQNKGCSADFTFQSNGTTVKLKPNRSIDNSAWYQWSFGDGTGSNQYDPTKDYKTGGSYTVCLKIKVDMGRGQYCYDSVCKKVEVKSQNTDSCSFPRQFSMKPDTCNRFTFFYGADTSKYDWYWLIDGQKVNQRSFKETFKEGTYKICVVVKMRGKNCTETICQSLVVKCDRNDPPKDSCNLRGIDWKYETTCRNLKTYFGVNNNLLEWHWLVEGRKFNGQGVDTTFNKNGVYTVCLVVGIKGTKCADTICKKIEINCNKDVDSCNLRGINWQYKTLCRSIEASVVGGSNNLKYSWLVDGKTMNGDQLRHTFNRAGKYMVCLIVEAPLRNCVDTICKWVEVKDCQPCNFRPIWGAYWLQQRELLVFRNMNGPNFDVEWSINGNVVNKGSHFIFDPKQTGMYRICMTVYNKDRSCKRERCITLVVINRKSGGMEIQVEDSDEPEEIKDGASGYQPQWNVMPNPVTTYLNLTGDIPAAGDYFIYNSAGKMVMNGTITAGESINVAELAQGVYLIRLQSVDMLPATARFIK